MHCARCSKALYGTFNITLFNQIGNDEFKMKKKPKKQRRATWKRMGNPLCMNIIHPSTMSVISDEQGKEGLLELKDDTDNKNIAMLTFM